MLHENTATIVETNDNQSHQGVTEATIEQRTWYSYSDRKWLRLLLHLKHIHYQNCILQRSSKCKIIHKRHGIYRTGKSNMQEPWWIKHNKSNNVEYLKNFFRDEVCF